MDYYLAIDIGASSGRHILGYLEDGRIQLEEIHRFENGLVQKDGELCWNLERLFEEIKAGMKKCKSIGKIPTSVGIDTWAVDFVLLNQEDKLVGNSVGYRDSRTQGMDQAVYSMISEEQLYSRTGIQKQIFNTIYQLMAIKVRHPDYLKEAEHMLMIPDYFNFLLCGVKKAEYTNATTTQLVSPESKGWDEELIHRLGYPVKIFGEIEQPGTVLGNLTEDMQKEIGFDCKVVLPATHDTGSAVLAVPSNHPDAIYLSSGTWSLIGIERPRADCTHKSQLHNFTNEGGYEYRFRYLKNIMGLWMLQAIKKEIGSKLSFAEICKMASKETISSTIHCNDQRFLAPDHMAKEVQQACFETNQEVPVEVGEIAAVIYNSLAMCYRDTVEEIEEMTGHSYHKIHVVGGGSNAEYLNQLTAHFTKRTVYAGPAEATAIGNILVQMISNKELKDLYTARHCVFESFEIKEYRYE